MAFFRVLSFIFSFFAALVRVELEDAYGGDGMAVLDCRGRVHLNQVYLCLEPDKDTGLPGEQVIKACNTAV